MKNLMSSIALAMCASVTILYTPSCKKSDTDETCAAGPGGNTEIVVHATINGAEVINTGDNDTVYVKYGTTSSPGTNPASYDKAFPGEAGEDHIHLSNLKCGAYYLYRTSYDTVRRQRFTGGAGINVTKTSGEVDTTLVLQ